MPVMLPSDFEAYTRPLFGALYEPFLHSFAVEGPVSIRLNPFKKGKRVDGEPIPWCKDGYWLTAREDFTLDPLFHCGCYYVQEAGSMFLDTVLRQYITVPITMLDLCAAPGGKATLARTALPQGSLLYCNETDRRRVNILLENMQKQGHREIIITNNTAKDYQLSGMQFDVILTDVPCSGEGLFRRDAGAIKEWSVRNVIASAERQRNILQDIWPCLKSGGIMIYSTCTFNTRENEENVRWVIDELGAELLAVETERAWGITGSLLEGFTGPVYRFIPGITRTEGLFMAVLKKVGGNDNIPLHRRTDLNVLYDGRHTSDFRTHKNTPIPAEALLFDLPKELYPRVDVPLATALDYLRHAAIHLDGATKGIVIVCYEGHPLGFANNIGTRANNLYPAQWRIRNK